MNIIVTDESGEYRLYGSTWDFVDFSARPVPITLLQSVIVTANNLCSLKDYVSLFALLMEDLPICRTIIVTITACPLTEYWIRSVHPPGLNLALFYSQRESHSLESTDQ